MRDSATLARRGGLFSGIVSVPISTVGVGIARFLSSAAITQTV